MKKIVSLLETAALFFMAFPMTAWAAEGSAESISPAFCIPFAGLLLCVAVLPLIKAEWWESHQPHAVIFWSLLFIVPFAVFFGAGEAAEIVLECIIDDYLTFIVLLFGLFCVAGNITLEGDLAGSPRINVGLLLLGTMLSSWVGTTGASMLMVRPMIMTEYNRILMDVVALPTSFASGDILDAKAAGLNALQFKARFGKDNHRIICISRTYGCGGNEIGFMLAHKLKIDYYDAEIFSAVLKRLQAEQDERIRDSSAYPDEANQEAAFATPKRMTLRDHVRKFSRYHGLSKRDAVFFNQSDLICDMAKKEDFIVMGRCADVILTNNHIPHISIFITAPFERRVQRAMEKHQGMSEKKAKHLLKQLDRQHESYYRFYTGRRWGNADNYDLCINSSAYGIEGSVDFILRMIKSSERQHQI